MYHNLSDHKCIRHTRLFICGSHLIARLSKTLPNFQTLEGKRLLVKSLGRILTAPTLEEAGRLWNEMLQIFASRYTSRQVLILLHDLITDKMTDLPED